MYLLLTILTDWTLEKADKSCAKFFPKQASNYATSVVNKDKRRCLPVLSLYRQTRQAICIILYNEPGSNFDFNCCLLVLSQCLERASCRSVTVVTACHPSKSDVKTFIFLYSGSGAHKNLKPPVWLAIGLWRQECLNTDAALHTHFAMMLTLNDFMGFGCTVDGL